MKKFFTILVLISLFFFSGTVVFAGEEEIIYDAYYLVTTPGENASTQMNINYHTHNTLTSLEYTVASDVNYENKVVVTGDLMEFEALDDPNSTANRVEENFELRNIVSVYLTGLTPGTEYRYRVNKGNNTYTPDYTFKTATSGKETTFLFVTDGHVHNYGSQTATEETFYYNNVVVTKALEKNPNISFILSAGDMVDRGGKSSEWDTFFQASTHLTHLPYVGTPGNHEYYHYGTGEYNAKFYNAHINSPKNGPEEKFGSTSYFIYNDILFVQLDTITKTYLYAQMEWFEETVRTNPTKYIVVTAHKPFQDYMDGFFELFEQFSVDLVLTGHTHSHNYKPYYTFSENKTADDPDLGVTYLTGYGSGVKGASDGFGYIITVKDEKISIKRFKDEAEQTYEINAKRPDNSETLSKQAFIDSIQFNLDEAGQKANLTWTDKAYRNVEKVVIKDNLRTSGEHDTKEYVWTPAKTSIVFDNIHDGYEYDFTATIHFVDGTTETIDYVFDLDPQANLQITYDEAQQGTAILNYSIKQDLYHLTYFKVYLNDQDIKSVYYFSTDFNKPFSIPELKSKEEYTVRFETYTHRDELIYSEEITFTTPEFKTEKDSGCKFGTLAPYTIIVGMSTLASCFFILKRKQS